MFNFFIPTSYTIFINLAVLAFIFLVIMAQNMTPEGYKWKETTLSNLALKGYKNAWVMRLAFIFFGIFLSVGITLKLKQDGQNSADFFVLAHGIGMFLAGIFSTAPLDVESLYEKIEDGLHSLAAYISGILLVIGTFFYFLESSGNIALLHMYFLDLAGVIGLLFFISKKDRVRFQHGVIQRLLYLVGLFWLLLNYNFLV